MSSPLHKLGVTLLVLEQLQEKLHPGLKLLFGSILSNLFVKLVAGNRKQVPSVSSETVRSMPDYIHVSLML